MAQPYLGQIIAVGFNFAPVGWLLCDGSLQAISQNEALFNLIGTTYGGDGATNFALPDLRGRSPLNSGQGPGLSNYVQGQIAGTENVTLTGNQVGSHSHTLLGSANAGSSENPGTNLVLGQNSATAVFVYGPPPTTTPLAGSSIGPNPGGQPHENRQPFLAVTYIICTAGIYPSQS